MSIIITLLTVWTEKNKMYSNNKQNTKNLQKIAYYNGYNLKKMSFT